MRGSAPETSKLFFPVSTSGHFVAIEKMIDVAISVTPERLWANARNATELHFAILAKAVELLRAKGHSAHRLQDVPSFSIGSGFLDSLAQHDGVGPGESIGSLVLESCARLIIGDSKNRIGPLDRLSETGKRVQVERQKDGAKAYRTHLTKRHEALRLMFWRRSDKSVEFANIGVKSELWISEGNREQSVHTDDCCYQVD